MPGILERQTLPYYYYDIIFTVKYYHRTEVYGNFFLPSEHHSNRRTNRRFGDSLDIFCVMIGRGRNTLRINSALNNFKSILFSTKKC